MGKIVSKRVLVIKFVFMIDVTKDFCAGGSLPVPDAEAIIAPINCLVEWAIKNGVVIIIFRDWHPADSDHFIKWPAHSVAHTTGSELHDSLLISFKHVTHFYKGKLKEEDGHSGWEGHNAQNEMLEKFMRESIQKIMNEFAGQFDEVKIEIYHSGLATDFCVGDTVFGSLDFGKRWSADDPEHRKVVSYLLTDTVRAVNLTVGDGDRAIEKMRAAGAIIVTTKEVMHE